MGGRLIKQEENEHINLGQKPWVERCFLTNKQEMQGKIFFLGINRQALLSERQVLLDQMWGVEHWGSALMSAWSRHKILHLGLPSCTVSFMSVRYL